VEATTAYGRRVDDRPHERLVRERGPQHRKASNLQAALTQGSIRIEQQLEPHIAEPVNELANVPFFSWELVNRPRTSCIANCRAGSTRCSGSGYRATRTTQPWSRGEGEGIDGTGRRGSAAPSRSRGRGGNKAGRNRKSSELVFGSSRPGAKHMLHKSPGISRVSGGKEPPEIGASRAHIARALLVKLADVHLRKTCASEASNE
jgi:hypothetical protein